MRVRPDSIRRRTVTDKHAVVRKGNSGCYDGEWRVDPTGQVLRYAVLLHALANEPAEDVVAESRDHSHRQFEASERG